MQRYSEDMDFSLLQPDESFRWETYFPYIEQEFAALGRSVTLTRKDKRTFVQVLPQWEETIRGSFLTEAMQERYLEIVRTRMGQMEKWEK